METAPSEMQSSKDETRIVIYRSTDRSGATYALSPETREHLKRRFSTGIHLAPRIFIAHETQADYQQIHGSIRRQVVLLLTGLSEQQVAALGPIEFRDAVSEALISE